MDMCTNNYLLKTVILWGIDLIQSGTSQVKWSYWVWRHKRWQFCGTAGKICLWLVLPWRKQISLWTKLLPDLDHGTGIYVFSSINFHSLFPQSFLTSLPLIFFLLLFVFVESIIYYSLYTFGILSSVLVMGLHPKLNYLLPWNKFSLDWIWISKSQHKILH